MRRKIHITESQFSRNFDLLTENSKDRKINNFLKGFLRTDDFYECREFLLRKVYPRFPITRQLGPDRVIDIISFYYQEGTGEVDKKNVKYAWIPNNVYRTKLDATPIEQLLGEYKREYGEELEKRYKYNEPVSADDVPKSVKTKNGYTVTRIDSYEELENFVPDDTWCIDHYDDMYDSFVEDDSNTLYIAMKDGCEFMKMPELDEKFLAILDGDSYYTEDLDACGKFGSGVFPYDDYGLSMLCIIVHGDGWASIWSRYNIQDSNIDGGDSYLTMDEASQILGDPINKVCPYVMWNNEI